MSTMPREVDVVVVGSGASGMAAALTASIEGLSVLLLEKTGRIGGSTAVSGGAVWAPLNSKSAGAGHPDTPERVRAYLAATVGQHAPEPLQRAFVDACGPMIDYFERHTQLRLVARTYSPDYYPDLPGAALGGRSLDPAEFDGRRLGAAFRELRDPLPEFTVLGGMMVNLTDVKHLLRVTRSFASWKHGMRLVLRFFRDRLSGYHRGTRLLLGNALAARLFESMRERRIPYLLEVPVRAIDFDGGRAAGVRLEHQGKPVSVHARKGVVIATGGFPWSLPLREEKFPQPTGPWSMSPQGNAGEGIQMCHAVGATWGTGHANPAFWAPVSVLTRKDGTQLRYPHLVWDRAKPGLMAVDAAGLRFVNESTSYHEFVRAMYGADAEAPRVPAFLVCDHDFMERWGLGLALPGGRPHEHLVRAGYLHRAGSLAQLAVSIGVPAAPFARSVEQFNAAAANGKDEAFGKGSTEYNRYLGDPEHGPNPCLGPLQRGPFYAVAVYPGDIGTACGIRCDANAQALDAEDRPIPGLYVVGNDMHSVMGGCYPAPGITLGPGLTFGWLAGRHLAAAAPSKEQAAPAAKHRQAIPAA